MRISGLKTSVIAVMAIGLLTGFGFGDISKKLGVDNDCSNSKDKNKCQAEETAKTAAKVAATDAAVKIIAKMIINYQTMQASAEETVVKEYKLTHKTLPAEPEVIKYTSSIKPGQVVKAGKAVMVDSNLVVVPGAKSKSTEIKEQIAIYDNVKNDKKLISLTKPVNAKTRKSGAFKNEFKFTLPVGMPQGVYPIKTLVLVNGKAAKPVNNKIQLVLNVDQNQQYQIVAMNP